MPLAATSLLSLLLAACGTAVSLGGGSGTGGADPGTGGAATTGSGSTSVATTGATTATGTGGGPGCPGGAPDQDLDADGYTVGEGDCDDCNSAINPGALEVLTAQGELPFDEDCDGMIDNVATPCDGNLAVNDPDPWHGAGAIELCKPSMGPKDWGVIDAKWVLPDGTAPAPGLLNFDVGHGMLAGFGPNVSPRAGQRVLALSSGTARQPTDSGYKSVSGFPKSYPNAPPQGFPKPSPACPGVTTGAPYDGVALEVTVRAPTNAVGFTFDFDYYTYEYPQYVCSPYNDVFVALLSPIPMGQADGNISFDSQGNYVTVNNVFLDVCTGCSLGTSTLVGTGFGVDAMTFEDHAATGWLSTSAPVQPGSTITMRWGVYDSGDGVLDSTTLVDRWRWITGGSPPVVLTYRPAN